MNRVLTLIGLIILVAGAGVAAEFSTNPNGRAGTVEFPQPDQTTVLITHSTTQNITVLNSVSCNASGSHADNSYARRFNLPSFGITDQFDVTAVEIAIESAASTTGTQPIEIRLHSIATADPLSFANLTLIATVSDSIADVSSTILSFAITGTIADPATSDLVVEVFTPNGQATGESIFIGSNADGQTDPSYMAAADCGFTDLTSTADIGFPDMHIVMNVVGDVLPVELMSLSVE